MNTSVSATTLLPREELVKLLCTADGKGQWTKFAQLALLFKALDKASVYQSVLDSKDRH